LHHQPNGIGPAEARLTPPPGAEVKHAEIEVNTQKQDRYCLSNLRSQLLDHPVYAEAASVEDLRRFMQDHVFAAWDFRVAAEAVAARFDVYKRAVVTPQETQERRA
jgi:hypothetical protein